MKAVSPSHILFSGISPTWGAIRLKMQFYGIDQIRRPTAVREWGTGQPIDVAIQSLELSLGNTRIEVPVNAYRNLLNIIPLSVTFREEHGKLFLYMSGGDGAETYETRLKIVGDAVKQRETVGGEFKHPQAPYEEITFKTDGTSSYSVKRGIPRQLSRPRDSRIHLTREESG
jgi:hypothetical protein